MKDNEVERNVKSWNEKLLRSWPRIKNSGRCLCQAYTLVCLFVWFGFLTSSSTTRLYRGRAPRPSVWQLYVLSHMTQSWETMTSVSAGHIILTPTQPIGSRLSQRESNPWPPHQESRALPTELPPPPPVPWSRVNKAMMMMKSWWSDFKM